MNQPPANPPSQPRVPHHVSPNKLPEEKRCEIRAYKIKTNCSVRDLAIQFGISPSLAHKIINEDPLATLEKHLPKPKEPEKAAPK